MPAPPPIMPQVLAPGACPHSKPQPQEHGHKCAQIDLTCPHQLHSAGGAAQPPRTVSLHLYGRMMNSFNTYDVAAGTRQCVALAHNES